MARRPSVYFCQLSAPLTDILFISVNFPCGRKVFRLLLSTFCTAKRPSINFRQLPLTFSAAGRTSVNFCRHSLQPGDLPSKLVNIPWGMETFCQPPSAYVNFPCCRENFCQLPSTFLAPRRPSINFQSVGDTLRELQSTHVGHGSYVNKVASGGLDFTFAF